MKIRIHKTLSGSSANGPGIRNVVWFQGCDLGCPGCFNPKTHDPNKGRAFSARHLCGMLTAPEVPCCGITISGGEPFQQPAGLLKLLQELDARQSPPILVFSGYPYSKLQQNPLTAACLLHIDALICGPYRADLEPDYEHFCSSSNQKLILLSKRFSYQDFKNLPLHEWIIDSSEITISGIIS